MSFFAPRVAAWRRQSVLRAQDSIVSELLEDLRRLMDPPLSLAASPLYMVFMALCCPPAAPHAAHLLLPYCSLDVTLKHR